MKNQKTKNQIFALTLALMSAHFSPALADEGSGVRGGGNVVYDVNKIPHLLDLKTEAKCWDDLSGNDVMQKEPGIAVILDKLRAIDWYFADDLEDEIRSLHFCYTGKLKFLPPVDIDAPVLQREIPEYKAICQLGIRRGNDVFIDKARLDGVPSFDRSLFYIHEAVHVYLPMNDLMRKMDLYTVVAAIADAGTPRVPDAEKFHFILSHHRVEFPETASELEPFKDQVHYLTATGKNRELLILAQDNPEVLINMDLAFLNERVAPWSRSGESLQNRMKKDIYHILTYGSLAEVKRVINEQTYSEISVGEIALAALPKLSSEKQALVFGSEKFLDVGNDVFEWLSSVKPEYSIFRIRANADLQSLAAGTVQNAPVAVTDLEARQESRDQAPLPSELYGLANYTVILIKAEKWEQVKTLITNNPKFYESFSLKSAIDSVDALHPKFKTDEQAKEVLARMAAGLKARWFAVIQGQVTAKQFKIFQSLIQ